MPFGKAELDSTGERVDGHDFEDDQSLAPPSRFAKGTPWPLHSAPPEAGELASDPEDARPRRAVSARPFIDELEAIDYALTTPVPREELEPEAEPLPPLEIIEDPDLSTRTLMGIGARAVRSVAKSGWVEARPATREPRATPGELYSRSMPPSIDIATPLRVAISPPAGTPEFSPRKTLAQGSGRVVKAPAVQPLHLPPEQLPIESPVAPLQARAFSAGVAVRPLPVVAEPVEHRAPARVKGKRTSAGYRVLGLALLAVAVLALAVYITSAVFYAFSTTWVMPTVISQSDDRVVALKASLAAQQHQRDRLAAELDETTRTLEAQKDPKSELALKASAHRQVLQASIGRQDEIIRGLEQSPYLRALADRAHVALVPFDNLRSIAPGTKVFACRVSMVVCQEVGRVVEVLPGEVSFKHPRREKRVRGQMVELQLSDPEAAARDVLFLGGAPLRF